MIESNDVFQSLLEDNKLQILRICSAYSQNEDDKKDLFQEVVINIWKSLSSFEGKASVSTWIYRVTLNTCMRARLKIDRHNTNYLKLKSIHIETIKDDEGEEQKTKHERLTQLYRCIGALKETEKNIVLLFLEDLPYKEIASITGVTENHIAVHMKRIKEKLLTCLNK